jgi:hypothetical protein
MVLVFTLALPLLTLLLAPWLFMRLARTIASKFINEKTVMPTKATMLLTVLSAIVSQSVLIH